MKKVTFLALMCAMAAGCAGQTPQKQGSPKVEAVTGVEDVCFSITMQCGKFLVDTSSVSQEVSIDTPVSLVKKDWDLVEGVTQAHPENRYCVHIWVGKCFSKVEATKRFIEANFK